MPPQLDEQLADHDKRLRYMQVELHDVKTKVAVLETEVHGVRGDILKAAKSADDNRIHLESLQDKVADLKADVATISAELKGRIDGSAKITNTLVVIVGLIATGLSIFEYLK